MLLDTQFYTGFSFKENSSNIFVGEGVAVCYLNPLLLFDSHVYEIKKVRLLSQKREKI